MPHGDVGMCGLWSSLTSEVINVLTTHLQRLDSTQLNITIFHGHLWSLTNNVKMLNPQLKYINNFAIFEELPQYGI